MKRHAGVQTVGKASQNFVRKDETKSNHFSSRHVRDEKYVSALKRGNGLPKADHFCAAEGCCAIAKGGAVSSAKSKDFVDDLSPCMKRHAGAQTI